jgi:hypothetical protein
MKYQININGTCCENKYFAVSKEAKEFWKEKVDSYDYDLLNEYVWDEADLDEIPESARFMDDNDFAMEYTVVDLDFCEVWLQNIDKPEQESVVFLIEDENIVKFDDEEFDNDDYLVISEFMKGTIFGGEIELAEGETFDASKLKIYLSEDIDGLSILTSVYYDEEEIENTELSLMGKGRSVYFVANK